MLLFGIHTLVGFFILMLSERAASAAVCASICICQGIRLDGSDSNITIFHVHFIGDF
jgi:hypothetical protein